MIETESSPEAAPIVVLKSNIYQKIFQIRNAKSLLVDSDT